MVVLITASPLARAGTIMGKGALTRVYLGTCTSKQSTQAAGGVLEKVG